jgi:hypothetical protein
MADITISPCCIDSICAAYSTECYSFKCECGQEIKIVDPSLKHKSSLGFLGVPTRANQHQPDYKEFL